MPPLSAYSLRTTRFWDSTVRRGKLDRSGQECTDHSPAITLHFHLGRRILTRLKGSKSVPIVESIQLMKHPELAGTILSADHLTVSAARFPLQAEETDIVRDRLLAEAAAARQLAGRTRFRTPEPVALAEPGAGYPLPWAVQTWLTGTVATEREPGESTTFAQDLAEFIYSVRAIDTGGRTFTGHGRGGDLHTHDDWIQTCLECSRGLLDVAVLRRMWESMRELPRGRTADVMTHGDLVPGNVLVSSGHLAGVLDVGGLADVSNV
jgi:aminoglycoside phosphotransferase (APT) family kinase protein